jgi:predicted CoA-binding protein
VPTVAILGASQDRAKYGNKAVRAYASKGYKVYPINPKAKEIEGHPAYPSILDVPEKKIDVVSFYLPPEVGLKAIEEVAKKGVKEVWLNPGAESPQLRARGEALGMEIIEACSIVGLGMRPSDLD